MSYIKKVLGPKREDLMRKLGSRYFGISSSELEQAVRREQELTHKGRIEPLLFDNNGNHFVTFNTSRGTRVYYFGMDEDFGLLTIEKPEVTEEVAQALTLSYRVKNNLALVEDKVVVDQDSNKPWGFYTTFARNKQATCKVIGVDNTELSLQAHHNRDEIWFAVSGLLAVYRGEVFQPEDGLIPKVRTIGGLQETIMQPGDGVYIPRMMAHSVRSLHRDGSAFVEVSLGESQEEDILRFYDKSGRVKLEGVPSGLSAPEVIRYCREKAHNWREE